MEQIMTIVERMCNTQSTGCRSLNKSSDARLLMDMMNIPKNAEICEIPLDWDNMVSILFCLANDNNYYSLFAGIGTDNNFHFELAIDGTLDGNQIDYYDNRIIVSNDYFTK